MAKSNRNNLHFLLFTLFIFYPREASTQVPAMCSMVNCGQGTCVQSSTSLLGFECECEPGWKKVQLGDWKFPFCGVPDCTVNLQCGNEYPSNHFQFPPKFDISNPCSLVWCGDGTCVSDAAGYYCQCNQGSSNLFNMSKAACFKKCNLGADCDEAALGPPPTQAPSSDNQSSSAGVGNGNDNATQTAPANNQSSSASSGNENGNQSSFSTAGNENVNQSSSARADNENADVPTHIGSRAVLSSLNLNIISMALLTAVLLI